MLGTSAQGRHIQDIFTAVKFVKGKRKKLRGKQTKCLVTG